MNDVIKSNWGRMLPLNMIKYEIIQSMKRWHFSGCLLLLLHLLVLAGISLPSLVPLLSLVSLLSLAPLCCRCPCCCWCPTLSTSPSPSGVPAFVAFLLLLPTFLFPLFLSWLWPASHPAAHFATLMLQAFLLLPMYLLIHLLMVACVLCLLVQAFLLLL